MRRDRFIGILLIMAMMLSLTCCSLGSMPSRTSSVTTDLESSDNGSETDTLNSDAVPSDASSSDDTIEEILIREAEPYMKVLEEGDPIKTAEYFHENSTRILPPYYECNEQIYYAVFSHISYYFGSVVTSDHIDYSLDVVCQLPDFQSCCSEVLSDTEFMNEAAKTWVLTLSETENDNSDEVLTAFVNMVHAVLREAAARINSGAFTGVITYNDSFKFHDNGNGTWFCKYPPDFVKLMSKDSYLPSLAYVDQFTEVEIIRNCGYVLVQNGELEQEKLYSLIARKTPQT